MKELMSKKQRLLRLKFQSYRSKVESFNRTHIDNPLEVCPTLEAIKSSKLEDLFWNFGSVTHPEERWATHTPTQEGIQAWLSMKRCDEELQRISREARQLIRAAIVTKSKLCMLDDLVTKGMRHDSNVWQLESNQKLTLASHQSGIKQILEVLNQSSWSLNIHGTLQRCGVKVKLH